MVTIDRILVLMDFSNVCEMAARYALAIARDRGAKVYFVHMVDRRAAESVREMSAKGYKGDFVQAMKRLVQDREGDLRELVPERERTGIDTEFLIRKGEPGEEFDTIAKELSIDLIVIGRRAGRFLKMPRPGPGITQEVVNGAPCPVLVVRAPEHDYMRPEHGP